MIALLPYNHNTVQKKGGVCFENDVSAEKTAKSEGSWL
jgi:hypothetical protein